MSDLSLPQDPTLPQYSAFRSAVEHWGGILADIAAGHCVVSRELRPITTGSNLVAALGGQWILKVFPPFLRHQFAAERRALHELAGRLPVAIPQVCFEGERDGWPYLIMTQLEGWPLEDVWAECTEEEKNAVLHQVGELVAQVHQVPVGGLSGLEPAWTDFMRIQESACLARHERLSLPRALLDGLEDYLRRTADVIPRQISPVILTGEYTPENLLMSRPGGVWKIQGLIDFGDVMVGFHEYDLLGPGGFLAAGRRERLQSLLLAYGYLDAELTPGLSRRLMRLLLLHRYSNLDVQIRIDGWRDRARSWDELQELVWPL